VLWIRSAWIRSILVTWIRIRIRIRTANKNLDPDPHSSWIRNRAWIRINLQMKNQNVWNMSLFEHIFKGLSLYLEARI
jgi:hypothetical protein